ncbi:hypothetical protein Tco_0655403 [Tanacetum coccineum]|uniref:Retrovirus-related Pol polyprotein from transposon TNT 1-94 n=1 Tax=Tanacetum coccineum TaxID=301880 RepID=A0ABQ4X5X8_9ASTR
MLKPGMYIIATTTTQNREPQLPHASRNTNPHVSKSLEVNHSTSVSRPQLKCYQVKDKVVPNNSQVKFKKKEVEDHHRISSIYKKTKSVTACNDSSKSKTLNVNDVCAECGKCVINSNHDACVSRYLNDMNTRTKKPKIVQLILFIVDSGCTKHMMGNLKMAFSDAGHAGCLVTWKSTFGGIQFLSDKIVSWISKKQNCTAMSSAEAEYVALSASCAQVIWMRTQLQDYGFNYNKIPLYCDSQSAIAISCNPVQHSRTKHIHTRYHFIKEQVENGIIELYFVRTEYQLADMFTKALPEDRFKYLVRRIGMRCLTPADLEVLTNETA